MSLLRGDLVFLLVYTEKRIRTSKPLNQGVKVRQLVNISINIGARMEGPAFFFVAYPLQSLIG